MPGASRPDIIGNQALKKLPHFAAFQGDHGTVLEVKGVHGPEVILSVKIAKVAGRLGTQTRHE